MGEFEVRLEEAVARVRGRVASTLDVIERFDWFAAQLEHQAQTYTLEQLEGYLHGEITWPAQREKVLVMLALHPGSGATEILQRWRPAWDGELAVFRRLALAHRGATDAAPVVSADASPQARGA